MRRDANSNAPWYSLPTPRRRGTGSNESAGNKPDRRATIVCTLMSESNFREIQLNTKQVVFLFMAFVVAAVGIFLLGVQVGQGVKDDGVAASAATTEPAVEPPAPTVMPPPTSPKPGDFGYHDTLQGKGDVKNAAPAPPSNPPAEAPPDPTPAATPAAKPSPSPATAKPTAPALPSPTAVWFVQAGSFGSRANADRQMNQLKSKGHDAFVFTAPSGNARYRVRIGPFERNAADTLKNRLSREGIDSTVTK